MASISSLRLVAGAGEPDDVPAKRIDVVAAAERYYEAAIAGTDFVEIGNAESAFFTAMRRYKAAVKRRQRERAA